MSAGYSRANPKQMNEDVATKCNLQTDNEIVTFNTSVVSVIIPCHNCSTFLNETLQSVVKQTHRPIEISAYDDGSTDCTWSMLQEWRATLEDIDIDIVISRGEDCRGPGYARNQAVWQSRGSYLCFLDADDWMHPQRIELQVRSKSSKSVDENDRILKCNIASSVSIETELHCWKPI